MKTAFVLRCHFVDETVLVRYLHMRADLGPENVFMLLDTTNTTSLETQHTTAAAQQTIPGLITISHESAKAIDPLLDSFNLPGLGYRAEAAIIAAWDAIKPSDHLWIIEYDVHCEGSWARALAPAENLRSDLVMKGGDDRFSVRTFWDSPGWCWWLDVFGALGTFPILQRVGGFGALMRVSERFVSALREELGLSTGFQEVYLPCLAVARGLSYEALPSECVGIVRYRPDVRPEEITVLDVLYHPVKPKK